MRRASAVVSVSCALTVLAGCGATPRPTVAATRPAVTTADPLIALTRPVTRRLERAGYAVYKRGPYDPFPDSSLYVEVDWTSGHAFKFWFVPFPTTGSAASFTPTAKEAKRFARSTLVARAGRIVYLASTEQECFGGACETEALPPADFRTVLALAEGR